MICPLIKTTVDCFIGFCPDIWYKAWVKPYEACRQGLDQSRKWLTILITIMPLLH